MKPSFYQDPVGLAIWNYAEYKVNKNSPLTIGRLEQELLGGISSAASFRFWLEAQNAQLDQEARILLYCFFITMTQQERMEIVDYYFGSTQARINANKSAVG